LGVILGVSYNTKEDNYQVIYNLICFSRRDYRDELKKSGFDLSIMYLS